MRKDPLPLRCVAAVAEPHPHHPRRAALGTIELVLQDAGLHTVVYFHVLAPAPPSGMVGEVQLRAFGGVDGRGGYQRSDHVLCCGMCDFLEYIWQLTDIYQGYNPIKLEWWGNTVSYAGVDGKGVGLLPIPERGYFGLEKGEFP